MNATTAVRYRYGRGEEVVAMLSNVPVHNIERGTAVAAACLPSWTIGVVMERRVREDAVTYVLHIEHDGCACVCTVDEGAIEGLA